ncbi:MAG TPA: serine hydrolase domain-containing protein [Chloroflexota bacterium]
MPARQGHRLSRRTLLRTGASAVLGAAATALLPGATQGARRPFPVGGSAARVSAQDAEALFRALDAKIEAAMAEYQIPGVAVGVYYQGQDYVRGYGVTNVDYPQPVDGDTLFRMASVAKTFTAATVMRLVEQGLLDLDAPLRTYLPDLRLADESVAARVTLRQCLNHSAGWLGDYYPDFGRGADAIRRYVASMVEVPQLTPLGQVYAYNNAAVVLAGHVIETVAGQPYEDVVRAQVLDRLGLDHTFFFTDELIGYNVAASHAVQDGVPVVQPAWWRLQRNMNPTGGLIASARDLLRYARFQLGELPAADGAPVLSAAALRAMRTDLGPGGTTGFEFDGVGVNWFLRRTAEGVPVFEWDGDTAGQCAAFFFVPERGCAITLLTNASSGPRLRDDLVYDDWALERFAGLHNPPAVPLALPAARLAPYEGLYLARAVDPPPGDAEETWFEFSAADGRLRARMLAGDSTGEFDLAFYRDNYVVALLPDGQPTVQRGNFVPGPDNRIAWFSFGGRLHARQG